MRLDRYLDYVCLFKTRSAATKAIRTGGVHVAGRPVKAGHTVTPGDIITIRHPTRITEVEVCDIPAGRVDRKTARQYYRVLKDEPLEWA